MISVAAKKPYPNFGPLLYINVMREYRVAALNKQLTSPDFVCVQSTPKFLHCVHILSGLSELSPGEYQYIIINLTVCLAEVSNTYSGLESKRLYKIY